MIKQNKIRYIEHDEMNKRLEYCKKYRGIKYGKKEGIKIEVTYADDLEAIDLIEDTNNFDAVWMSNSIWLYMLENAKVTNSKSIYILILL